MKIKRNTILIVFDELTNYKNLPKDLLKLLKGYNLFKKRCVEFSNIQTSRQQCTPSRSTIMTGIYNTSLQDNIDYNYQYDYFPNLPTNLETSGKIFKKNGYDITSYYGKQHLDSKLATSVYTTPTFNTASNNAMDIYGYDKFNIFGDTYYSPGHGLMTDNQVISYILPPNSEDFDYISKGVKLSGVIPFLKARLSDRKSYYIECHITNPHDTNHFIQNFAQIPSSQMNQFSAPFYFNQIKEEGVSNIYEINKNNQYAVPKHPNLINNYFENNYDDYKSNKNKLPFIESFELDYALNPLTNSYNPLFIGTYNALISNMTLAESQNDIKSWKNLINNYYGLVLEADSYLEKLYYFFEENHIFENNNIIIIADHGDQLSAHGLKQKQLPFKECSNVPCLIYSPDLCKKLIGKEVDFYGSLVDILPTQIEMNSLKVSSSFDGKSLLKWNKCKLELNIYEHQNYIPLNIVNSSMYTLNYFFYVQWYNTNYNGQSLSSNPKNYFEYQSSFCTVIVDIKGTKYKFGRYYSIYSQILYFLFINKLQNRFSKINFIEYIISIKPLSLDDLILYIKENFNQVFTFEEGLNIIYNDFGDSNIYILYYYYAFIANILNNNNNFVYLTPGCQSSWEINNELNIFSYLLYNLDTDPSECFNLLDPKNIDLVDIDLKIQLNNLLNLSILEKNCQELVTIIAENNILSLGNILYLIGGIIDSVLTDSKNLELLGYIGGNSSIDGFINNSTLDSFNKLLLNATNNIGKSPLEPYYLFDSKNNIYFVGDENYIKLIYNNLPFFKNTILVKGFPDLKNNNFIPIKFNLLPYLQGFKILNILNDSKL